MGIQHQIEPVYDNQSRILILGSFPSVKSRESGFFYGHPQNRFWKVLAAICDEKLPETKEEKITFLLQNQIAVWDVIASCDIEGSSDSSIKNVIPADISRILDTADIREIYCNGTTAYNLYRKHLEKLTGRKATKLPSTSPANAARNLDKLIVEWRCKIF